LRPASAPPHAPPAFPGYGFLSPGPPLSVVTILWNAQ
jgi:hypothetical protein